MNPLGGFSTCKAHLSPAMLTHEIAGFALAGFGPVLLFRRDGTGL